MKKLTPGQTITLTLGLISAFVVIIAAFIQRSRETEAVQMVINATQTAEARFTEIAQSATVPPTEKVQTVVAITSTATLYTSNEPSVPTGYSMFDDFTGSGNINTDRWIVVGKLENCNHQQSYGFLNVKCETSTGDVNLGFLSTDENLKKVSGIAIATEVLSDDSKGSMDINVTFEGTDNETRVYFLQLRYGEFKVAEFYPQKDWVGMDLAKVSVDSGKPHIVRAEYHAGLFNVWVDDIQIQMQPNLPNNANWVEWKIEPYLACYSCDKGILETNIFWTAILP